ncbi:tetratricopeptide repeat protein, partial [Actinacidiphila rubida]
DAPVEVVLAHLPGLPPEATARAERSIAWVRDGQQRYAEGLVHARRALAVFRTLGQRDEIAAELGAVGWFLSALGAYAEAIPTCEEAITMLQEAGNRGHEAAAWDSIGYARQRTGDARAAIADYERSLRLFAEEILDDYSQAAVLDHLASAQLDIGDTERARATWNRAADIFEGLQVVARAAEMRANAEAVPVPPAAPAP